MFGGGRIRSSSDSPLEGAGFEPSVPLEVLTVGIVPCRLRGPFHASLLKTKFAADSALERSVCEPSVPQRRSQTTTQLASRSDDCSARAVPTPNTVGTVTANTAQTPATLA